jgi:hypothetical protein
MKTLSVAAAIICSIGIVTAAETKSTASSQGVVVIAETGQVETRSHEETWQAVSAGDVLEEGSIIRTSTGATADLLIQYNGSVFRLAADSELRLERLRRTDTGVEMVTDTRLAVLRGALIGSQRKLHKPSVLEIVNAQGKAVIRGTEYIVNAQGAVSVLSGSVEVNYNLPGNKGSIKVTIPAGSTFDPATGTVVPTTPSYLQNVIADVTAVRQNADVYKAGGATIVVKPDTSVSPSSPNGNNGVGNGVDPQPPGNPPVNDGPGTSPGNPGNKGGNK